jgi:cell wall-associated NlpC family hydrolase
LKFFKKIVCLSVCALFGAVTFTGSASAQTRDRVVKTTASQPTNLPAQAANTRPAQVVSKPLSRPTLTNDIVVVGRSAAYVPPTHLVKKTGSAMPVGLPMAGKTVYDAAASVRLDRAIRSRYGIPYRYGSTGPYSYDCSGFVWSAFQEAGINFTRASAASLWSQSEPVEGADRFKYGTLVFMNGLGHVGIVADENGFYHASSSKGITYSPFAGYWANRIVGFRRLRPEAAK